MQGNVEIENNTIEDFIILRNDGTPTYNLSATVDDHQMNMTHIIRGDGSSALRSTPISL